MVHRLDDLCQTFITSPTIANAMNIVMECHTRKWFSIAITLAQYFCTLFPRCVSMLKLLAVSHLSVQDLKEYSRTYQQIRAFPLNERDSVQILQEHSIALPHLLDAYISYPEKIVKEISDRKKNSSSQLSTITFSITTCKRYDLFEKTMNSFLRCCRDLHLIHRWIVIDDNSSSGDREEMKKKYPFFDFYFKDATMKGHPQSMNVILAVVDTPYLFHMEDDWKFFLPGDYITECLDVINSNGKIGQCLINRNYAELVTDTSIAGGLYRTTDAGTRYYIHEHSTTEEFEKKYPGRSNCAYWPHFSFRPSLLRVDVLKELGSFNEQVSHFEMEYARRYVKAGYISAFFEGVYCMHTGRLTSERHDEKKLNAYILNNEQQFSGKEEKKNERGDSRNGPPDEKKEEKGGRITTTDMWGVEGSYCCFVVNMDRRPDRWYAMKKQLSTLDFLHANRFSAVDGAKLKPTTQLQQIFDGNDYNMRAGMVGCAMSHIKLYVHLVNSNHDGYIILEDDIEFVPDFQKKLEHLLLNTKDWDMIYLGHHLRPQFRQDEYYDKTALPIAEKWDTATSLARSLGGTGGYIISKRGATRLLNFINKTGMTNGIDTVQQKAADEMNIYYPTPHLIYSECYLGEQSRDTLDTDIQFDFSSLTIPIDRRFMNELVFYSSDRITICHTPEDVRAGCAETDETKPIVMVYKSTDKDVIRQLKAECGYPSYTLNDEVLLIVPSPTKRHLSERYFERLCKDGKFNVDDAIVYRR